MNNLEATSKIRLLLDPDSSFPEADNLIPPQPAFDQNVSPRPEDFPGDIPLVQLPQYENWSMAIHVNSLWVALPQNANDVVRIANWAVTKSYKIRAMGKRHNWSPITVPDGMDPAAYKVLLVDTNLLNDKVFFPDANNPTVRFGTGVTIEDATAYLQSQDNGEPGSAPGFSFINMTGPGDITLGGAIAVGAHGTSVHVAAHEDSRLAGCLSNLVVAFTAVVSDPAHPGQYMLRTFLRSDPDASAFLVHLGRSFLTDVTMRVVRNYFLEQQNLFPPIGKVFEAPSNNPSPNSLQSYVNQFGRVEVIWFPTTLFPWVRTWEEIDRLRTPTTDHTLNEGYITLSKSRSIWLKNFLKSAPVFTSLVLKISKDIVNSKSFAKLSGTSRDLLIYVPQETLRITALGYAVQISRNDVQKTAYQFMQQFHSLHTKYSLKLQDPINASVELRYTSVDYTDKLGVAGAQAPGLAATAPVRPADDSIDTVFWVDILSIPGANIHTNEFYHEMEEWMHQTWGPNMLRPEWSKGWAYTPDKGAWSNPDVIARIKDVYYSDKYEYVRSTLASYDKSHIFSNPFLDILLPANTPA